MRWRDRVIGVVLGLILGVGAVVVFVFVYSEQTVDAPSLSGEGQGAAARGEGSRRTEPPPVATVRVIGGAPPASGPAELHYRTGDLIRLRLVSDTAIGVQMIGYGIERTVPAGRPTTISFKASRPGSFPLLVTASHIDVARITVSDPPL
jgi:hypothetical protein